MSSWSFRSSTANLDTACTFLQVTADTNRPFKILRAWAQQTSSTTSAQAAVEIVRKTAAATTGLSSVTGVCLDRAGLSTTGAATATAGECTSEGTDGDVCMEEGFNVLNGWVYLPVPEERIAVKGGGIIALKFTVAGPSSATWKYGMIVDEVG